MVLYIKSYLTLKKKIQFFIDKFKDFADGGSVGGPAKLFNLKKTQSF